jgi:hypothetical protein
MDFIMRHAIIRIIQTVSMFFCVLSAAQAQNGLASIDGNWYSAQWKYGYVLKNGMGTATSTNSPNFQVGQNIIQLTATSPTTFSGQQVYTDGKFYNVQATLQADGRLYFEGAKNAKWFMERVGAAPRASAPPAPTNTISTRFILVNRSSEPVFKLFISPLQSTGWGTDILGEEVLMPGYEQPFNPGSARGCTYDVRVEYRSKRIEEKRNLNLCQLDRIIFDGSASKQPAAQSNQNTAPAAPRPSSYDGTTPLRCGTNVNCRIQAEVVQKMQMRWGAFSRSTHYGSACLQAIQTIRSMHPAVYGDGSAGFVQPQMDVCSLR